MHGHESNSDIRRSTISLIFFSIAAELMPLTLMDTGNGNVWNLFLGLNLDSAA